MIDKFAPPHRIYVGEKNLQGSRLTKLGHIAGALRSIKGDMSHLEEER